MLVFNAATCFCMVGLHIPCSEGSMRVFACVCVCNISNQCTSHRQSITRPGVVRVLETSSLPAHVDFFSCSVCVLFVVMDAKIGDSTFRKHKDSQSPKGPGNREASNVCCFLFTVCLILFFSAPL